MKKLTSKISLAALRVGLRGSVSGGLLVEALLESVEVRGTRSQLR